MSWFSFSYLITVIYLFIDLFICLFIHLFICLFIHLFICLFIYVFVYLICYCRHKTDRKTIQQILHSQKMLTGFSDQKKR